MNEHPYLDVIKRYLKGCNTGDKELMMSAFSEDIMQYALDLDPIQGSETVANFWVKFFDAVKFNWSIDHVLVQGNEVVFEWSAMAMKNREWFERGTEWIVFKGNKISEIRAYYDSRNRIPEDLCYEHRGFPHKDRGYAIQDDFEAHLP
jgi:hypothetical protein